jgi:preprotein translocase subunit SecF
MFTGFHFIPPNTRIGFVRLRTISWVVSALLTIVPLILVWKVGLNYGIDFQGGTLIEIKTPESEANLGDIRAKVHGLNLGEVQVQEFGAPNAVLIRIAAQPTEKEQQDSIAKVKQVLGDQVEYRRVEVVGPTVSSELIAGGTIAVVIAMLAILVYIWFRFEWQFAVGAVVTLILDITKAIGFLAITRIEFDLVMVAAILTILGYSTNDKVVVYDRVRENLRKYKTMPLRDLIDLSINETLNRTLGTSMTVFLASLPLALFGGESISGFAWVMLFGIVVGTSSSIFIAAPILLFLGEHRLRRDAAAPVAAKGKPATQP